MNNRQTHNFDNRPSVHMSFHDTIKVSDNFDPQEDLEDEMRSEGSSPSHKVTPTILRQQVKAAQQNQVANDVVSLNGWTNIFWKRNALLILVVVVKFVVSLLTNSEKFKFTFINRRQFNAVNDKSSFFQFYLDNKLIREKVKRSFQQKLVQFLKNTRIENILRQSVDSYLAKFWIVINPHSSAKVAWDIFLLAILVIQMVYIPLKICFFVDIEDPASHFFLDSLPLYVFIIEMILNFMTGYYKDGCLVFEKATIAKYYFKSAFVYDFISTLPLFFNDVLQEVEFIQFFVLLKIKRLVILTDQLEEVLNLRLNYQTLLDVGRLLIQFLFISHLFGCVWHYIGMLQIMYGLNESWITYYEQEDKPLQARFITSVYWSSITTLTIGYGDISPVTDVEKLYVILIAILSSVVFAYTLSNIGQIFSQLNEIKKVHRYKMSLVQQFIIQRGVNKQLQNKVKKFFEYFLPIDNSKDYEIDQLMGKLVPNLKSELKIDIYRKFISNSKLLRNTFSNSFLDQLCQLVQERQFTPDEFLFQGDQLVTEIYFIIKGEVSLQIDMKKTSYKLGKKQENIKIFTSEQEERSEDDYIKNMVVEPKVLATIKKNHVLGERFFVTGEKVPYSAKSLTLTRVGYIQHKLLMELLAKYPEEMEKFNMSKNKLVMQERIRIQGCEFCYQNHQLLRCPFVFYQPNIRLAVKRQDQVQQLRQSFIRDIYRQRRKKLNNNGFWVETASFYHALSERCQIVSKALEFAISQNLLHEESLNESLLKDFDYQCDNQVLQPKFTKQATSDSSVNTLLQRNLTNQNDSIEKIERQNIRQGSTLVANLTQNMRSSVKQLGQYKALGIGKKLELKHVELKLEKSEGLSPATSPDQHRKSFSSNFLSLSQCVDVQRQLYIDFIRRFMEVEEIPQFEKRMDFAHYYPNYNLPKLLELIEEKRLKSRKRPKTRRRNGLVSNSLRHIQKLPRRTDFQYILNSEDNVKC